MRRFFLLFPVLLTIGQIGAQKSDLAKSYYHFSLAKMHDFHRQYTEAIGEFEKAISLNPASPQLRVEFARTLWEAGENRRAVEECQKAIEEDPANVDSHFLLAQIYFGYRESGQEHMLDKALEEFAKVVELDSKHFDALYSLGRLQLVKHDYKGAAESFSRLNRMQPSPQGHYLEAVAYVEQKELHKAISILEQSLGFREGNVDNLKLLGRLYQETQQNEKALQLYTEAMKYGADWEVRLRLAQMLTDQKKYKEAIPLLREAMSQAPQNLEIQLELAKALNLDRKYAEAADALYNLLKHDADHVEANYELGRTLAELGERLQAIEKFNHLLKLTEGRDGKYSTGLRHNRNLFQEHLALLYQETRQYDKAIQLFRDLVQATPDQFLPKLRLIYAFKEAGRLAEALSFSEETFKEHSDQLFIVVARAQVLSAADNLDKAIAVLREEIKRNPDEEQFYLTASQLFLDHKKHRDAEKIIREGLSRKADSERMRFQLGAVYEQQKEFKLAETTFKKILEKNADHAGVLNYLGYMLAERSVRLQEALGYIKRAVEIDPYNSAYLDSLGWVYFKLNELGPAEINLKRAAQLSDADATIYDHLGELYFKLGHYDKAREYYEQSVSLAKEEEEHKKVREKLADLKKLLSERR